MMLDTRVKLLKAGFVLCLLAGQAGIVLGAIYLVFLAITGQSNPLHWQLGWTSIRGLGCLAAAFIGVWWAWNWTDVSAFLRRKDQWIRSRLGRAGNES